MTTTALTRVETVLNQFPGEARPQAVTLALRQLGGRIAADLILASILAFEAHARSYWSIVQHPDGRPYETEEDFFNDVLHVQSFRSAAKRIAIGRLIQALTEGEREPVARELADLGLAKATVLLPALEQADSVERARWFAEAKKLPVTDLQAAVSKHLEARPRGRPDADRLYRVILGAMPSLEDRELCERFFALGRRLLGPEATTVGVLRAGFQETLADWEPRAKEGRE